MYPEVPVCIEVPVALILANLLYLSQALLAFFYVQYLNLRVQLLDMKLIKKHEMYDWTVKYQISNTNLSSYRQFRWNVVFYCILGFSAVVALQELFRSKFGVEDVEKIAAVVLASAVLDVGVFFTFKVQFELRRERLNTLKLQIIRAYNMKNTIFLRDSFDQIQPVSSFFLYSGPTFVILGTTILGYLCVLFFTFFQ
jgi:hypothetical protein